MQRSPASSDETQIATYVAKIINGEKVDLRNTEMLKRVLERLKQDPNLSKLARVVLQIDNSAGSQAPKIMSSFLINIDHPVAATLEFDDSITISQLSFFKKAVQLNPYVQALDINQEVTVSSTKIVWDFIQNTLERNREIDGEGYKHNYRLRDIIHDREVAHQSDPSIVNLPFPERHSSSLR